MKVNLVFARPGFIADPYWGEMYRLIEIQKKSGVNRVRSASKARSALEDYLRQQGMTLADYEALEKLARRPFHTTEGGEIIIPSSSIHACISNANDVAPRALQLESPRSALTITDFRTGKTAPDGAWERFAVVKSGSGKTLSNQRGFRSSSFIADFTARGEINVTSQMVKPEAVLALLSFAGRVVGIGASRKMGWGRFEVNGK